ncbi:uncharacterized protein LOC143188052 [Calliopsis andreniformis]|uniref:uncharacterized protein LOC143188052 n=1 Tax=Calliopsis andreniformis TaxID=337506 RepID=UPI003FCC859A
MYGCPSFTWSHCICSSSDGKPWKPSENSRICSLHFCGGEKSNNPANDAYNPTIFPSVYKTTKYSNSKRTERLTARRKRLQEVIAGSTALNKFSCTNEAGISTGTMGSMDDCSNGGNIFEHVATQIEPIFLDDSPIPNDGPSTLFCWQNSVTNEASTQTSIVLTNKCQDKLLLPLPKKTKNVRIDPDYSSKIGFAGFEDVKDDTTMKKRTVRILNGQNRLLLFLMKMKLRLSFGAIGCIFKVSKTSASNIFYEILETLYEKTKTWIFWPSREAVKEIVPSAFKDHPNCRAIIDCSELPCDTPPTVEQRIHMYSRYKSGFTVKFLIAISPSGMITFISKGYGGCITDGFITNDSGFISLVKHGDEIMADKEFPQIKTALLERQCALVMPPFAMNPQFTAEEIFQGYSIASVRILFHAI